MYIPPIDIYETLFFIRLFDRYVDQCEGIF